MSEPMPERTPPPRRGRAASLFTERIGPLPMWGWVAVVGGGIIAWRWWSGRQAAGAAAASTGATAADQVPQFVNQTYTTVTPPATAPPAPQPGPQPHPGPRPQPKPPRVQREWTAPRSGGTLAEVAQRLTGRAMPSLLTPANAVAQKFIEGPYKKNPHAPIPKGAKFTYEQGQVEPGKAA